MIRSWTSCPLAVSLGIVSSNSSSKSSAEIIVARVDSGLSGIERNDRPARCLVANSHIDAEQLPWFYTEHQILERDLAACSPKMRCKGLNLSTQTETETASKTLQGIFLRIFDIKKFIQFGDRKHFIYIGTN